MWMSQTGLSTTCSTCWIILVIVSVENSGALKSGECTVTPRSRSFAVKNVPFVDFADEANPCR